MSILSMPEMSGNRLLMLAIIQGVCGTVFLVDILYESHLELANGEHISLVEAFHLSVEVLAVALLYFGYFVASREFRELRLRERAKSKLLTSLRGEFDTVVFDQFAKWGLTESESDIALLSLRGLRVCDIAEIRTTKVGTIKAQLHAVFRKANVRTRSELLGFFMDEILDFASNRPALRSVQKNGLPVRDGLAA